jgi:hypothetical protein
MTFLVCMLALGACAASPAAGPAVIFDGRGMSWETRCTVEALQGLVNRGGPRLYVDYGQPWSQKWLDIYAERHGLKYERVAGLRDLLARFRGVPKGLVAYDPAVDGSRYVAITLAGVEDLLPVTTSLLSGRAPELAPGTADWPGLDFRSAEAEALAAFRKIPGASFEPAGGDGTWLVQGNTGKGQEWCFASLGPLAIDLSKYPLLEADVPRLDGQGALWGIKLTWDRDGNGAISGPEDDLVLDFINKPGVFRWDIAKLAGLSGRHTFAYIQLHAAVVGARVLWRGVRFVSPDGQAPPIITSDPLPKLLGVDLKRDLRGKFKDSLAAYDWALREVMPRCDRRFAHACDGTCDGVFGGGGPIPGFDWQTLHRGFVFNLTPAPTVMASYGTSKVGGSPEQARMYERILAALERPCMISGYGEPEGHWCSLLSKNGHFSMHAFDNWSFHTKVAPPGAALKQRVAFTPDNVKPETDKYYVCFMTSEGDTMKGPIPFFFDSWWEKERGSVPMNWGISPLMGRYFPAMLGYYYDTATPNDYFFAGCSGAGYCYPDNMPNLDQFARHTAEACRLADIRVIDLWGCDRPEIRRRYAELTRPLGLTLNSPAGLLELIAGVPAVHHHLAYWQATFLQADSFTQAFADESKRAEAVAWVAAKIESIARSTYPPGIILVYSDLHNYAHHCRLHAEIARALDPARFKAARLDEAICAWRAWARGRIVVGGASLNERPVWAALEGTPTALRLSLANASDKPVGGRVKVEAAGRTWSRDVTLRANASASLDDFVLNLPAGTPPGAARLSVEAPGGSQSHDVLLSTVPAPPGRAIPRAKLAGFWPAPGLQHRSGSVVADADGFSGQAWASPDPGAADYIIYGPYVGLPRARYLAAFRLKLKDSAGQPPDASAVTLETFAGGYEGLARILASRDLTVGDFARVGEYQWFTFAVDWPGTPSLLETRVNWHGKAPVIIDRVALFELPDGGG